MLSSWRDRPFSVCFLLLGAPSFWPLASRHGSEMDDRDVELPEITQVDWGL